MFRDEMSIFLCAYVDAAARVTMRAWGNVGGSRTPLTGFFGLSNGATHAPRRQTAHPLSAHFNFSAPTSSNREDWVLNGIVSRCIRKCKRQYFVVPECQVALVLPSQGWQVQRSTLHDAISAGTFGHWNPIWFIFNAFFGTVWDEFLSLRHFLEGSYEMFMLFGVFFFTVFLWIFFWCIATSNEKMIKTRQYNAKIYDFQAKIDKKKRANVSKNKPFFRL